MTSCSDNAASIGPHVKVTPKSLAFEATDIGINSDSATITIENTGWTDLLVNEITVLGDFIITNNCPEVLKSRQTGTVIVRCVPSSGGLQQGAVLIDIDNLNTIAIPLRGSGNGDGFMSGESAFNFSFSDMTVGEILDGVLMPKDYVFAANFAGSIGFVARDLPASTEFSGLKITSLI